MIEELNEDLTQLIFAKVSANDYYQLRQNRVTTPMIYLKESGRSILIHLCSKEETHLIQCWESQGYKDFTSLFNVDLTKFRTKASIELHCSAVWCNIELQAEDENDGKRGKQKTDWQENCLVEVNANGDVINTFPSIKEAAKTLNYGYQVLYNAVRKGGTYKGRKFVIRPKECPTYV